MSLARTVIALTVGVISTTAHCATVSRQPSVISIHETVSGSGESATAEVTAVQTPMSNISGFRRSAATGGVDLSVQQPPFDPWQSKTTFDNDQHAEQQMGSYLRYESDQAAERVCALLKDTLSTSGKAVVQYSQPVVINGRDASIRSTLIVRPSCESNFLGVEIVRDQDRLLVAIYNQGAVGQNLPQGHEWQLPKPGILTWRVFSVPANQPNATRSAVEIDGAVNHEVDYLCGDGYNPNCAGVDTGNSPFGRFGLFDAPQMATNSQGQDRIINCKTSSSGRCDRYAPNNMVDPNSGGGDVTFDPLVGRDYLIENEIKPLMTRVNAQYAVVRYGRQVQPVYVDNPKGPGQVPKTSVRVDKRTLEKGSRFFFITPLNGGTFKNEGSYGYQLSIVHDISMTYQSSGRTDDINQTRKRITSPSQSYRKEIDISDDDYPNTYYAPRIIDPFQTDAIYRYRDDDINNLPIDSYTYVAPLMKE